MDTTGLRMTKRETGHGFAVRFNATAVRRFADSWPCSGLQGVANMWFVFDHQSQLVGIINEPEHADGAALNAMADDAKAYAYSRK